MIVDISYSVDVEEIPSRLAELFEKDVVKPLQNHDSDLNFFIAQVEGHLSELDDHAIEDTKEKLYKVSLYLSSVQRRLRNIDAILRGYQKCKLGLLEPQPPEQGGEDG